MAEGGDGSAVGAQMPGRGLSTTDASADGNGGWLGLYDQAMRAGSNLQTLHHNGGAPDDAARQQYRQLQGSLARALADERTPDEARVPLGQAAYGLYVGGNIAGLAGPDQIPPAALRTMFDAIPFSGGGEAPSGVGAWRQTAELPTAAGNRTATAVVGNNTGEPGLAAREPNFPEMQVAPSPKKSEGAGGSPGRGLAPPATQSSPSPPILTKADFPEVSRRLSQRQYRHIFDHPDWLDEMGGYFHDIGAARDVLEAYHSGEAAVIGRSKHGSPVVKLDRVTGFNNNRKAGYVDQPTNIFMIKGTTKPSVVPVSPSKEPKP